jgi:galactokinase
VSIKQPGTTLSQLLDPNFSATRLLATGMSDAEANAKGNRFSRAAQSLIDAGRGPNTPATAVFVPGRIEVLGKHTDYCGGRSLICTVERGMCFVATPNAGPKIRFFALDLNQSADWALDSQLEPTERHWSNYPMTVARRIARNFSGAATGADIAVTSDLPAASGLSSSSAMIIGTFLVLSAINNLENDPAYRANIHTREDLAGYLGCTENGQNFGTLKGDRGVGTFGGSQDHTAILCCKPRKLSVYSFCPVRHERDVNFPDDLQFFIADSAVVAEKTGDALAKYNRVSERARMIVSLWNESHGSKATCLRDAVSSPSAIQEIRAMLVDRKALNESAHLTSRLEQFLIESERLIPGAADAIDRGDWKSFGQLVNESQQHAVNNLENQVKETIALHKALLESGAMAASAFGAGFGGSVWGLYSTDSSQAGSRLNTAAKGFSTRPGCAAVAIVA